MSVSEVEIVSGLTAGDQLVVSDTSLFEGARTVLIRRKAREEGAPPC